MHLAARPAPSSREKASWRMPVKRSAANYEETGLLVCGNDVKLQLFVELLPSCLVRQGSAGGTLSCAWLTWIIGTSCRSFSHSHSPHTVSWWLAAAVANRVSSIVSTARMPSRCDVTTVARISATSYYVHFLTCLSRYFAHSVCMGLYGVRYSLFIIYSLLLVLQGPYSSGWLVVCHVNSCHDSHCMIMIFIVAAWLLVPRKVTLQPAHTMVHLSLQQVW